MKYHRMALGKFMFYKYGSEKVEDGDPVNLGGGELWQRWHSCNQKLKPGCCQVKVGWCGLSLMWMFFFYSRLVVHPKEEARVRASVEVVKVKKGKQDICTCIFVSFCICICIRWKRARRRCPPGSLTSRWSWRGGVWGTSGDSPSSTGWCHLIGGWWPTYADTF